MTKHMKSNKAKNVIDLPEEISDTHTRNQNLTRQIFVCLATAISVFAIGFIANQTLI